MFYHLPFCPRLQNCPDEWGLKLDLSSKLCKTAIIPLNFFLMLGFSRFPKTDSSADHDLWILSLDIDGDAIEQGKNTWK
jgi:hypothetical protein